MRYFSPTALGVLVAFATFSAHADTVSDWNQTAIETMKTARVGGNPWSRSLAMMHVAMSDAINSTHGRYTRIVARCPRSPTPQPTRPPPPRRGRFWCSSIPTRKP